MADQKSGLTPAGIQLFRTHHEEGSEREASEISERELAYLKAASSRFYLKVSGACAVGGIGLIAAYFIVIVAGSPIAAIVSAGVGTLFSSLVSFVLYKGYQKDIAYLNLDKTDGLRSHYSLDLLHQKKIEK